MPSELFTRYAALSFFRSIAGFYIFCQSRPHQSSSRAEGVGSFEAPAGTISFATKTSAGKKVDFALENSGRPSLASPPFPAALENASRLVDPDFLKYDYSVHPELTIQYQF